MNRVFLVIITLICITFQSCNQNKSNLKEKLKFCIQNKDYATAANTYVELLLNDTNNMEYSDSLSRIYIKAGNYEGGVRLGEKVVKKDPKNSKLLELMGVAYERLGKKDESISTFNSLYKSTNNSTYLYKLAVIYYESQNITKADSIIDAIIAQKDTVKKIEVNLPDGTTQSVPILAAAYNVKGAIEAEGKNNLDAAVKNFKKSLEISPTFQFPQLYLQRIQQFVQQNMRR